VEIHHDVVYKEKKMVTFFLIQILPILFLSKIQTKKYLIKEKLQETYHLEKIIILAWVNYK